MRDPNGQASQTGLGAPAEPEGRKAKLPRAGPGAPGLCRPLYRLLCRDSKNKKLRPDVTTCLLPSSLPLPSLLLLHPLPTLSPLTEVPSPPRAPTRLEGRSGLRPSVARYRGGGVLPARWLGEKMGCPRPEEGKDPGRERLSPSRPESGVPVPFCPPHAPSCLMLLMLTRGSEVRRAAVDRRGLPQPAGITAWGGGWDPIG